MRRRGTPRAARRRPGTARRRATPALRLAAAALPAVALLLAFGVSAGERLLYEWTDAAGVVRYTPHLERIPEDRRNSVRVVRPGEERRRFDVGDREPESVVPEPFEAAEGGVDPEIAAVPETAPEEDALDARILVLEVAIARDEAALENLISQPRAGDTNPLLDSSELREIARRLPRLQEDLRALEEKRDAAADGRAP